MHGVSAHAHHLRFDQRCSLASVGALRGLIGDVIHLVRIGAVHDKARYSVSNGTICKVFACKLAIHRRRICPKIVLDYENHSEFLHGGEVEPLIGGTGGLSAVTHPGETGNAFALQARAESNSGKHRDQVAEHGDGSCDVALMLVPKMGAGVAPAGWRVRFGHVLHHHVPGLKSADQKRTLIADHRPNPVSLAQRIGRGAGAAFLAETEIHTTHYLLLLEKILERLLHLAIEQHVAIDLDALFFVQVLRFA